ncbi:LysR family transcriptional regulator [Mesorhizobium sp. Z1-4]|uniref:LysR family transcriptional regulator n=1 Tax=Mesorhizobium sp. Z1-4 TaxID=2448478 RepID=UPI000FDCC4B8|nr:LysR family transcriptional regulator [Mesorhizobium sp. Z1-4]
MDTLTRMRAFIEVVEAEGFSAAARKIGRSKALLSKYVRELEDELGALLLNRTTRQFSLTEAGHDYFKRATEIVNDIDALAESVRERSGDVRGRIKLTAPRTFADAGIGRSLIDFARDHPDIRMDIQLDDRFVDLVEEGFDIAIRITRMQDSSLIARKLRPFSVRMCASPALIDAVGRPEKPQDLAGKPCVIDTNGRWLNNWQFKNAEGEAITVQVDSRMEVNSPIAAREAAIAGLGFVGLPDFIAEPALASGNLVAILDDWLPPAGGIYAVYPHRRYLPAKIRVFVDYLAQWMKTNDTD